MSETSKQRSVDFLKISSQFKLGSLVTEASHPVTAHLSEVANKDIPAALNLLFQTDADVLKKFREFAQSGRAETIAAAVLAAVRNGGRIFFTGCGSTGRLSIVLDSIWRDFWKRQGNAVYENRAISVMAGGDFALIKSVEGFEDFTAFGKKQMADLKVSAKDVVFAITEGGETSFVIGTAWAGVEADAKVYFVYNNPDEILCGLVQRSREVIEDTRIEKINLTTGPMAITGSTRMQATSIQLAVMLVVLEIVVRELTGVPSAGVAGEFLAQLETAHATLGSPELLAALAQIVELEEKVYRTHRKNNYYADRLGIDVLTDTTERSPTYCTPPFRKFDDAAATESWAFLFLPETWTDSAWENLLKRKPRCVEWKGDEVRALVDEEKAPRTLEIIEKISSTELMRFKIGINGAQYRDQADWDGAIAVVGSGEREKAVQFFAKQLEAAGKNRSRTGLIAFGPQHDEFAALEKLAEVSVFVPVPKTGLLLDGVTRVTVKLLMNALSTCTMVRLGRVMGNFMVWVVPSNLKLIDRATRYITKLTGLDYEAANDLLFEIIEYVEPRMKADQAYPPVVRMAVLRTQENLTNEEAEKKLKTFPTA
jgi:N-acetylmuramic acid 6-phosphate etherase